ncbi:hypothetical protein E4T56_gene8324 [Termitomyces sp. T112]|nr:hypothetical protein E4T56_gene8324 [Termitomyces sp. T112]
MPRSRLLSSPSLFPSLCPLLLPADPPSLFLRFELPRILEIFLNNKREGNVNNKSGAGYYKISSWIVLDQHTFAERQREVN